MVLTKRYEDRLHLWKELRDQIDQEDSPIEVVLDFWNSIPKTARNLDPYDSSTWPSPWEMIEENEYCEYTSVLAVGYTLMLTEKYKDWHYEIKVGLDRVKSKLYYILLAGDHVIGINSEKNVHLIEEPTTMHVEISQVLSPEF